jgi:uncharacterized membrane protein
MRGILLALMALGHTRHFFHADAFLYEPTDLARTYPVLFFTRILTHICAPTFVLLSGIAIRLNQERKSKKDLSVFLLKRGLWLLVLEFTVIRFSWMLNFYYDVVFFQVIWAIGISMIMLAALIHLPFRVILSMAILIITCHDFLHAIQLAPGDPLLVPWSLIHQSTVIVAPSGTNFIMLYPFLPWLGILLLGYCLGKLYTRNFDNSRRRKLLFQVGLIATLGFIVIRLINVYGDPLPWSQQKNALFTFMSFVNVTKYPPSLLYTLMTLGPVLMFLSWLEKSNWPMLKRFQVFGSVSLFYYLLHFYLLRLSSTALYLITTGKNVSELDFHFATSFGGIPAGEGYSLAGTFLAWIILIGILYPICSWYRRYKSTHKQWWLSYL